MKIVLTLDEAKEFLLAAVNTTYSTRFNEVSFDGYSNARTVTFEEVKPEPKFEAVPVVQS